MESKECTKCKIEKSLEHFTKRKASKDGKNYKCKSCQNKATKKYRENNLEYFKKYRVDNAEKLTEYFKQYDKTEHRKKSYSRDFQKHKEERIKKMNKYNTERRKNDDLYSLTHNMRSMVRRVFRQGGYKKNTKSANVLDCTYEELLKHLNDNLYGFVYGDDGLDVDHIIPISSGGTQEEMIKLSHYSNLQLLPSEYNRYIKRDKLFNKNHFKEWLAIKFKL